MRSTGLLFMLLSLASAGGWIFFSLRSSSDPRLYQQGARTAASLFGLLYFLFIGVGIVVLTYAFVFDA